MPQIVKQPKTQIKIVPKEGEIEITLNINISIDGQVTAATVNSQSTAEVVEEKDDRTNFMIPDFLSGSKLKFGKNKE